MALVNDDCMIPTKDVPELGYIKESSNEQYVPDVFYADKDKYGNEVTHLARPLPVEYLLVDLPAAFPVDSLYTLKAATLGLNKAFAIENRMNIGEPQDFEAFSQYLQQVPPEKLFESLSDFHLLIFMSTCDMLPLKEEIPMLLQAMKNNDTDLGHSWLKAEAWATVEQLIQAHTPLPTDSNPMSYVGAGASPLPPISGGASDGPMWTCSRCTYLNQSSRTACEMCVSPRE
ncbi:hypothetical protein CAPTEDRAFT_181731 [Capitella teleta]|uniref:RanBP2-type domain-containing protein n=1 Tax=Capitella teleta TaxID=283909 RepID=R7UKJ1_CAPTE|nr:hypothetical protein CAPTEDRAFT_181731 [Capitella teleta]|eukprot:ELU06588.1 hypothetical protein CAPTEDRAFT_181731 [Capitella teleta]